MNIARWFSYTRLLEQQLADERKRFEREQAEDRAQWETQRRELEEARERIENVVFQAHGVNIPHRHPTSIPKDNSNSIKPPTPRAIGPIGQFGLAARNAQLEQDTERRVTDEVRRDPATELSTEQKERIRNAAEARGVVASADDESKVA